MLGRARDFLGLRLAHASSVTRAALVCSSQRRGRLAYVCVAREPGLGPVTRFGARVCQSVSVALQRVLVNSDTGKTARLLYVDGDLPRFLKIVFLRSQSIAINIRIMTTGTVAGGGSEKTPGSRFLAWVVWRLSAHTLESPLVDVSLRSGRH